VFRFFHYGMLYAEFSATKVPTSEQYIKHMPGARFGNSARFPRNQTWRCSLSLYAGAWEATMQDEHDVWNTADVRRAIRRRIGQSLSAGDDRPCLRGCTLF
jgi:hypothetical protein